MISSATRTAVGHDCSPGSHSGARVAVPADLLHRAHTWILSDDTGISSEAIWAHMLGVEKKRDIDTVPHDGGDLGRCLRLLKFIPEWAPRMPEMAAVDHSWARIIPHWDRCAETMAEEVGIDWSDGRWAPKTYALMRQVLEASPAEAEVCS